jgi:hypothetical protein
MAKENLLSSFLATLSHHEKFSLSLGNNCKHIKLWQTIPVALL